jgi:hypothetical protein
MPTAYVKKMAKKHNISVEKSEEHWANAKKAAKNKGGEENWGLVTAIYKQMIGESTFSSFVDDINSNGDNE